MSTVELEPLFKFNLDNYMDDVHISIPARVVGVQRISEGLIDVQPLINKVFPDGSKNEYPIIHAVPVIMPCTSTSSITMPINQGDTVLLMFCQKDIDVFKNGGDTPHDPSTFRTFNMNDAVALIGLSPIDKSRLSKKAHNSNFDNNSLMISHNVGTDRESYIKIDNSGNIDIGAKSNLNISAESINIKSNSISVQSTSFDINSIVTIEGMNLNNFMRMHVHPYTDDGRPMETAQPIGY